MIFEKIISEGLACNSYFISSESEAAVIDPRRDIDVYLHLARKNNVKIKSIFDTHRNEDFVNGSVQLAHTTGANIYHGHALPFKYGIGVKEGQKFPVGKLEFSILETPGHTPESISVVLKTQDDPKNSYMVFTGDTLFVGDVGRIDFYRDDKKQKTAAGWLYDSIFNKLLNLGDGTLVYPAHGSGSVCGGGISSLPFSTIGYEKATNPRLQLSKEEFIALKSVEKFHIAPYMPQMEHYNLNGPPILNDLPEPEAITVKELQQYRESGAQIVDCRKPISFTGGHVPNTLNIWKSGLPTYAGWFLTYDKPIVVVKNLHQDIKQIVRYFIRLGFDNIKGYLPTFAYWYEEGNEFTQPTVWSAQELHKHLEQKDDNLFVIDVLDDKSLEKDGKIAESLHIYLGELPNRLAEIPKDKKICVYCDSGYKSSVATSVLLKNGYKEVITVMGGIRAWIQAGYPVKKK